MGAECGSQLAKLRQRCRRQIHSNQSTHPPIAALLSFTPIGVAVVVKKRADKCWAAAAEWIAFQQLQRALVILQQFLSQPQKPKLVLRHVDAATCDHDRKRKKPHKPIEAQVIRRYLRRHSTWISRLCFEGIFLPLRLIADCRAVRAFDHNFVSFPGNASKCAVGVHQMETVVAVIHELSLGKEIQYWLNAQNDRCSAENI